MDQPKTGALGPVGRVDSPALHGTWLGRILGAWNPFMKRILMSPLHLPLSRWFAVIEWTGRKSGKRYRTPVAYLARVGETWITSGDRWWLNLAERPNVAIWIKGTRHDALAEPVLDRAESARLHARMFQAKPFFARLAGLPGRPTNSEIERSIAAGRMLVRVTDAPAA